MDDEQPESPGPEEPPRFLPPEPPGGYPPTQPPPAQPPPGGFPPPEQPPPGYQQPPPGWPPPAPAPPPGYQQQPAPYGYGAPPHGYQQPPPPPAYPPYPPAGYGPPQGQWQAPPQQQVRLWRGRRLAGWWPRVGAAVLDGLVVALPAAILGLALAELLDPGSVDQYLEEGDSLAVNLGLGLMTLLCYLVYKGLLMARRGARNGQTLGMQLVSIRVVREDQQPVSWGTVLLRETLVKGVLFGYVAILTLFVATLLNYLWPLWDSESRALHDMLARTRVVTTE